MNCNSDKWEALPIKWMPETWRNGGAVKLTPVGALAQAARNTGGGERLNNSSEDVWSAETAILGTLDAH